MVVFEKLAPVNVRRVPVVPSATQPYSFQAVEVGVGVTVVVVVVLVDVVVVVLVVVVVEVKEPSVEVLYTFMCHDPPHLRTESPSQLL